MLAEVASALAHTGGVYVPEPPPDMQASTADPTAEWIFTAANAAIFIGGTIYAIRHSLRARTLIPVLCMLGGALCIFTEPMVDSHLQVWWSHHAQPDTFSAWGRHIPMMVIAIVGWYFGLGTYVRWAFLQKYGTRFNVWLVYACEVGAAVLLEPAAIQMNLWHYYGEQGLRLFGYPVWWPCVGGACGVVAGTLVYKLTPYLTGIRVLLAAPLIPMGTVAVYWAAGLPMFNALNREPASTWISYAAAFTSIGLALLIVWICTIATGRHDYSIALKRAKAEQNNGDAEVVTTEHVVAAED